MNRIVASLAVLSLVALPLAACEPDGQHGDGGGYGGSSGGYGGATRPPSADCSAYTSCGACTPIVGCGWCEGDDGSASCASGPSQCMGHSFHWNWDPAGCTTTPPPIDAGSAEVASETSPTADPPAAEASTDEVSLGETSATCAVPSAATFTDPSDPTRACGPTFGGSLCGEVITVACHGRDPSTLPAPPADLGCTVVPDPTPSGTTFYCCPCGHS